MNHKLHNLTTDELIYLLNQERKKFIVALDYGSSGSDLQEIRDQIKTLEILVADSRTADRTEISDDRQSVV